MAYAVLQTAEDQITCSICLEIFEEPKALPCLHTFCRECIRKYIIGNSAGHQVDIPGFSCPTCRRFVPTRENVNVKNWADDLQNNHMIITMIAAYNSPRTVQKNFCKLHTDKEIEFYCFDHSLYVCSICSLQHRRCHDLRTADKAEEIMSKGTGEICTKEDKQKEEDRYKELFFEQCNFIEHAIDGKKNDIDFIEKSETEIRNKIISTRQRLIELLAKHEEKILTRLAEKKTKAVTVLQHDIDKYEKVNNRSKNALESLQKNKTSNKSTKKTLEKITEKYEKIQRKLSDLEKRQPQEKFEFSLHPAIEQFLNDFDSFGKLSCPSQQIQLTTTGDTQASQSPEKSLQLLKEITIPVPSGKSANVTGMTVLPSGQLLLADHLNEVILLYDNEFELTSQLKIKPPPYDVVATSVTENEAMMSCPDSGILKQVFIFPKKIQIGQELQTGIQCWCVGFDDKFMSVCSKTSLQIYETDGDYWISINSNKFERTTKITYVTLSAGLRRVFMTDQKYPHPQVLSVSFDGQVLWKIEDERLSFATGIAIFKDRLLVASWDTNKVVKICVDGKHMQSVIDNNIAFPWKLCVKNDSKQLILSQHKITLTDDQKRVIKVFGLD